MDAREVGEAGRYESYYEIDVDGGGEVYRSVPIT